MGDNDRTSGPASSPYLHRPLFLLSAAFCSRGLFKNGACSGEPDLRAAPLPVVPLGEHEL